MSLIIRLAKLDSDSDTKALGEILDAYAREPNGQSAPIEATALAVLADGLRQTPASESFPA